MKNNRHNQQGFTLFELLIALSISSVVLMTILSTFTDFLKARNQVLYTNRTLTLSELIIGQLTFDIHRSAAIELDFQSLTTTDSDGVVVVYRLDPTDNRIYRNDEVLTPDNFKITAFDILDRSANENLPLLEITIGLESLDSRVQKVTKNVRTTISTRANKFGGEI